MPSCFARLGGACGPLGEPLPASFSTIRNQLMFLLFWELLFPPVIVAVITQMICSTVTSSQCHLKLKNSCKNLGVQLLSGQWRPDLILQSMFYLTLFVPLGLRVGDGRFQGPDHLEDVCVNLLRLLTQNTTGWQLIEQKSVLWFLWLSAQGQVIGRVLFFSFFVSESSLRFVDIYVLPEFLCGWPSVCVWVKFPLLTRFDYIELGPL